MKKKTSSTISLIFLGTLILAACGGRPEASFEISGAPDPLFYGGTCGATVITFTVTGPADGLEIKSIIAAYNLFDGSGKKVGSNSLHLYAVPGGTPITYDATRIIFVPDSGGTSPAPDEPILVFGDGSIEFAATIFAKILTPAPTGPEETYYFTTTKSIPVLPCRPVTPVPPTIAPTFTPIPTVTPKPTKKPKDDSGGPPAPPSCTVEPNNPNCVNP